jgi:hypothetical protein
MAKKSSALPLVAGGAALLLMSGKKKKKKSGNDSRWGVSISSDCNTVSIVDPGLFDQFLYGAYDELASVDSGLRLIQITDALFGEVAPQCSGFPEQPESAEIAELYAVIARAVGSFMIVDPRNSETAGSIIDDATQISFIDWYRDWRNYPTSDVPDTLANQVAFASDMSNYKIGENWYEETVRPFVQAAHDEGRLEVAFADFANNRGVLVGKFVMPISGLPQSEVSTGAFINELEAAISQASSEVFTG